MAKEGRPVEFWAPKIGEKEKALIGHVLRSNFLNDGDVTREFEKRLEAFLDARYAVAVTSGTAALFLSLAALDIRSGDEVIVPDVTFIATANAVRLAGAKVVLADVSPDTMTMDPDSFSSEITQRTRAVIPVHVSGRAADIGSIRKIASKHGIAVIEDAAEALGSMYEGKYLGTFGHTGAFSFSPNKIITTGQGGLIVTDDPKLRMRLRELKDQGRPRRGTGGAEVHRSVGYNFKLTNLQAAVGLGQLLMLEKRLKRMKEIYEAYAAGLGDVKGIRLLKFDIKKKESPQWIDAIARGRNRLCAFLLKKNIRCRKFWYPLHAQAPYRAAGAAFPASSEMSGRALWLPSAFTLKDGDIARVCGNIRKFYA